MIDPAVEAIRLYDFLSEHGIAYERHQHPAAHTVAEAQRYTHHIKGAHCKNLFLKLRKNHYAILTIPADAMIDLQAFADALGLSQVRLGHPTRMELYLRVTPGNVTPLALINDHEQRVALYIDDRLAEAKFLNFPPLDNRQTVTMSQSAFRQTISAMGRTIQWIKTHPAR